ncbi:MAG: hypothetical protein ACLTNY_04580, partial [Blautia massiliensis (ex Durand et al. 2017)]
ISFSDGASSLATAVSEVAISVVISLTSDVSAVDGGSGVGVLVGAGVASAAVSGVATTPASSDEDTGVVMGSAYTGATVQDSIHNASAIASIR